MKKLIMTGIIVFVSTALILMSGCGEQETTRQGYKTYSKYGFSFEYPRGYSITEMGGFESEATDASGMVQAFKGDYEGYQVVWLAMIESMWELGGDLQTLLEDSFVGIEYTARVDRGELVETTKVGHPILYQYYTLTYTDGSHSFGVVASFYCDRIERVFLLITMHSVIWQKQDILEDFQRYLDSFVCH